MSCAFGDGDCSDGAEICRPRFSCSPEGTFPEPRMAVPSAAAFVGLLTEGQKCSLERGKSQEIKSGPPPSAMLSLRAASEELCNGDVCLVRHTMRGRARAAVLFEEYKECLSVGR